jgi:hypothetical protein
MNKITTLSLILAFVPAAKITHSTARAVRRRYLNQRRKHWKGQQRLVRRIQQLDQMVARFALTISPYSLPGPHRPEMQCRCI